MVAAFPPPPYCSLFSVVAVLDVATANAVVAMVAVTVVAAVIDDAAVVAVFSHPASVVSVASASVGHSAGRGGSCLLFPPCHLLSFSKDFRGLAGIVWLPMLPVML